MRIDMTVRIEEDSTGIKSPGATIEYMNVPKEQWDRIEEILNEQGS